MVSSSAELLGRAPFAETINSGILAVLSLFPAVWFNQPAAATVRLLGKISHPCVFVNLRNFRAWPAPRYNFSRTILAGTRCAQNGAHNRVRFPGQPCAEAGRGAFLLPRPAKRGEGRGEGRSCGSLRCLFPVRSRPILPLSLKGGWHGTDSGPRRHSLSAALRNR